MNYRFSIDYRTDWGQYLCVELHLNTRRDYTERRICRLDTEDGYKWVGSISLTFRDILSFEYRYMVMENGIPVRKEWNKMPRRFSSVDSDMDFYDQWLDTPSWNFLYTSAFSSSAVLEQTIPYIVYYKSTLILTVHAPHLKEHQALGVLGSQPPLGVWDTHRLVRMQKIGPDFWFLSLNSSALYFPFEYKYVVLDERTGALVQWEEGANRMSPSEMYSTGKVVVLNDVEVRLSSPLPKLAGVVVPVFSLRSKQSQGVGDFSDLRRMVDWAASVGMQAIQILPINDTTQSHTWSDSYPYNVVSVHALHPMYLDLRKLPPLEDKKLVQKFEDEYAVLNSKDELDYEAVNKLKDNYLRLLYKQKSKDLQEHAEYQLFCQKNAEWLVPYTVFCMLRDKYHTADFASWPAYREYKAEEAFALFRRESTRTGYYAFQQYLLHVQLSATASYARSKKVLLKGDIPIGVSRYSVEAWAASAYLNMDGQAGAPPDEFSTTGQNWGFPTYNWEALSADGYRWWTSRLQRMSAYFDAYRIDHVLGFFRIWEIPQDCVDGLLGHFYPALPLSEEEIESYGLSFDAERMTQPLITDGILEQLFGKMAAKVKRQYLAVAGKGTYTILPQYATQRLVQKAFLRKRATQELAIRDGLYHLLANVLFLRDKNKPNLYHPRIDAPKDFFYASLSADDQQAFSRLYEDYFYHRHNDFWAREAMKKLPAIVDATNMLSCAEDLGMVPSCVAPVMKEFGMLSLEIESMPKVLGRHFAKIGENPYCSVSTIFTHDMPTLRLWWEESPERTQEYYTEVLGGEGAAPQHLDGRLAEQIVSAHLRCPSMLCLISLQDWLSMDERLRRADMEKERINVPANPRQYWCYRMHIGIEQLGKADELNTKIRRLIENGGRLHI